MKILAARRLLVVADADAQMAREFLREVAGIEVGRVQHSQPDLIRFDITEQQFTRALQALTRNYGQPERKGPSRYIGGIFYLDASRTRYIELGSNSYKKGPLNTGFSIAIGDTNHKETRDEFLKRLLRPQYLRKVQT